MQYPAFKSVETENDILENGFVCIPSFLCEDEVQLVTDIFEEYHNEITSRAFWVSLANLDSNKAVELSIKLLDLLKDRVDKYFDNAIMPVATLLNKYPRIASEFPVHRDSSVLDESRFAYRNLWIPLVDITDQNGSFFMLPKSHRYFTEILPIGVDWPYQKYSKIIEKYVKVLHPKKGDLVVYDQRMVHGSWDNKSDFNRPIIQLGVAPDNCDFFFYKGTKLNDSMHVDVYGVESSFYLNPAGKMSTLNDKEILYSKEIPFPNYTNQEFESFIKQMV